MIDHDLRRRLVREIKNLFPLFRYLILQTETHAFCLALASAALIGFFSGMPGDALGLQKTFSDGRVRTVF
jgi:hypothetical protein